MQASSKKLKSSSKKVDDSQQSLSILNGVQGGQGFSNLQTTALRNLSASLLSQGLIKKSGG
jgi:hypothetical protein